MEIAYFKTAISISLKRRDASHFTLATLSLAAFPFVCLEKMSGALGAFLAMIRITVLGRLL